MMENQQWPAKYQQSVATALHGKEDGLNNGNGENDNSETNGTDDNDPLPDSLSEPTEEPSKPTISVEAKQTIAVILDQIKSFTDLEKYLLRLELSKVSSSDPLRQPLNPLGSRSEIHRTITWIKTHLEEDPDISLPKQLVYDEYFNYCSGIKIKALSQADFGKVMKQVYPKVRARRLGTRGNSRYCYSGLRKCHTLKPPLLADLADKTLLSTEPPCTQSDLAAAAWIIIKEWADHHFGMHFSSLQTFAHYLVISQSVCVGSEAANKLTTATALQLTGGDEAAKCGTKHREMQIQLQRKIHQKNEIKEKKRKTQSPKCEQSKSTGAKRSRRTVESSPPTATAVVAAAAAAAAACENSTSTTASSSTSSTCTSPTQGKPICDKSLDFTQISALPDFQSFQKKQQSSDHPQFAAAVTTTTTTTTTTTIGNGGAGGKVAIPRLTTGANISAGGVSVSASSTNNINNNNNNNKKSPQSPKKLQQQIQHVKTVKYKAIQPKPKPQLQMQVQVDPQPQQQCDIASYNPLKNAEIRSQDVHNVADKFKERKSCEDDNCDDGGTDFTLTRERLDSISSVDKDAMDEYLGTNNSQHEEELSQYFKNPVETDNTTKLSQLRQLLQEHVIPEPKPPLQLNDNLLEIENTVNPPLPPIQTVIPYVGTTSQAILLSTAQTKRRVSFENPMQEEIVVPPSPNTRRKNFSFCPIKPGPQSPNTAGGGGGRQSKCSSTNVSPLVSPRNTPKNAHFILPQRKNKIKRDELLVEIDSTTISNNNNKNFSTISAPASPLLTNKSFLQKLLNSDTKVCYTPDYNTTNNIKVESGEIDLMNYRSQSVPLQQMIKSDLVENQLLIFDQNANDFNDLDPIPDAERVTVDHIINSLNSEPQCDTNIDNFNLNQPIFFMNNNINNYHQELYTTTTTNNNSGGGQPQPATRNLNRSQSIDVNICYESKCNPSRSVPNTPLPFNQIHKNNLQTTNNNKTNLSAVGSCSSRSYPSTPLLVTESAFNYTPNGDCLLNGQPIRTSNGGGGRNDVVGPETDLNDLNMLINLNDDNNLQQEEYRSLSGNEFGIVVENDSTLMDTNCVLIEEQNYHGNIN